MWRTAASGLRKQVGSWLVPSGQPLAAARAVAPLSMQTGRGFAGKAEEKPEEVPIPIQMHGVSGKYASALFVTAVRGKVVDPVEKELKDIVVAADNSEVFSEFLRDPSVPKDVRIKAVEELFVKSPSYSDVTKNFMAVLAENGRLKEIFKISSAYSELVLGYKGEVKAIVTSALELSPEELKGIKESLKGHLSPGQTLHIEQKVDRSIIAGIVIDILDKHIDLSIDTRIKQMEKALAENL